MRRYIFVVYCALLVVAAGVLAEFVLLPRMFGMPRALLLLGFTAQPHSMIDDQPINTIGFTGDVPTIDSSTTKLSTTDASPNVVRILVLGSSTMFNRHMADKLKIAFQKKLPDKKIELLDAGIRSHTTRADVLKLKYLTQYRWNYVLFYDGINDLWANHVLPQDFYPDYRQLDSWYRRNALLDNSLLLRHVYNKAYLLYRNINQTFNNKFSPDYQFVFPKKPYINAAQFASLPAYSNNVETIIDMSQAMNATPVLITFASYLPDHYSRLSFLNNQLGYTNPDNYDSRDVYNWGPPEYVREGLRRENTALRDIAAKRNVLLIDMDAAMSGKGEWFGDVCHFNNAGAEVFAEQVATTLAAFITTEAQKSAPVLSP